MNNDYYYYQIEQYKNLIEGDLKKLTRVRPKYLSDFCSFEEYVALEERILENFETFEAMYRRNLFYRLFSTTSKSRLNYADFASRLNDEFKEAFTSIKTFIEINFPDENMYEFVFIIYSRIVSLLVEEQ